MSRARCPRIWQAEAVGDARLSPADRASFERHLESCRECAEERAGLSRLRRVASRLPVLESTPLRRRFLHQELLRRANERSIGENQTNSRPRWLLLVLAAMASVVIGVGVLMRPASESSGPVSEALGEPQYRIVASQQGRWHTTQRGRALRLALSKGIFTVEVGKLQQGQSFVLELPDGELEVRGTQFRVEVESKTLRVEVHEGLVELRLRGQPELALGAGDAWPKAPETPETPEIAAPEPSAPALEAKPPSVREFKAAKPAPDSASEPSSRAQEYAVAMAAFSRADFATAEQLFLEFEGRYPASSHVEDLLFLRALCRLRRGDPSGARALAHDYLSRYPSGFRAEDAKRLLLSSK